MDGCRWSIQGVLAQYDISDLEQIELCKIRTSGQYLANFHQYEFYCIAIPLHSTNFIPIAHTSGNRTSGDRTSGGPPVKSQKLDHPFETSQSYFIQLHTLTATMICKLRKFKVVKFNITDVLQARFSFYFSARFCQCLRSTPCSCKICILDKIHLFMDSSQQNLH